MSSLFKSNSISPSGVDSQMPPSLFALQELHSVQAPAFIYVPLPVQGQLPVTHVLRNDSVGGLFASIWMRRANLGKTNWVQPRGRPQYPVIFEYNGSGEVGDDFQSFFRAACCRVAGLRGSG